MLTGLPSLFLTSGRTAALALTNLPQHPQPHALLTTKLPRHLPISNHSINQRQPERPPT